MTQTTDLELTMHEQQQVDDALNALGGCWSVNDYKGGQRVMARFLREIQQEAAALTNARTKEASQRDKAVL